MEPRHYWWLVEAAREEQDAKRGGLSKAEKAELYDMLAEAKAEAAEKTKPKSR